MGTGAQAGYEGAHGLGQAVDGGQRVAAIGSGSELSADRQGQEGCRQRAARTGDQPARYRRGDRERQGVRAWSQASAAHLASDGA
jgi:hypothetical protein